MSFFGNTSTAVNTSAAGDKDVEIPEPPTDSISSLSFSPQADYLAIGSWDNSVRILISEEKDMLKLTLAR